MRRRTPLRRTVLVATVCLVVATALALLLPIDRVVVAPGVLTGGTTAVRAPLDARVERVLVRPGEPVSTGSPLLVLDSDAIRNGRARAEARIAALDERVQALASQLDHLRQALHPQAVAQARLEVERTGLLEAQAEHRLEALEKLLPDGIASEAAVVEARAERDVADVDQRRAQLALDDLPASQAADLAAVEAQLRESRASLDEAHLEAAELARQESESTVTAPCDGTVLATALDDLVGRKVLQGEELLHLGHGTAERFEGTVGDLGRPLVREGMRVKLRIDGYPWLIHGSVPGRVAYLDAHATSGGFPVEIALEGDRGDLVLRDGMHGTARILVEGSVPLGRLLLERLVGPQ